MMRPKVLNLIQKFEKLTNEISSPKPVLPERQRSVVTTPTWRMEESPASPSSETTPTISQHGWTHKPLVAIEEGIRGLMKKIETVKTTDEKAVFALFMEMLDLLIQLSSIDTDGLKSMKIKKECCVVDLKKARYQLTELIGINEKEVIKASDTPRAENKQLPLTTGVIVNHDSDYDEYTDDEDDEETALVNSSENAVANDLSYLKSGVVNSLTKRFETEHKQEKQAIKIQTFPKLVQVIHTMESDSEVEIEEADERPRSASNSMKRISGPDILSEIEYYQEIVPTLDREDFIKIESIEEHLEGLLVVAETYPEPKQRIIQLLKEIKALKEAEVLTPVATTSNTKHNNEGVAKIGDTVNVLINQEQESKATKILCEDFLQAEKADVWIQKHTIPEIVLDEPETEQSTHDRNGFTGADDSRVGIDRMSATVQMDKPIESQNCEAKHEKIRVLGIDTPGDDLTASLVMLNTYKEELQDFLAGTKEDLLKSMGAIEANLQVINKFTPHPNVEAQFAELRNSYQEVFDFITEAKFAEIFNETFEDRNDNVNIRESVDAINNFQNLCAEVRNYYPFVEKLNLKEPAQVEVLRENMTDLFDEIEKNDVSFNPDLQIEKESALQEIEALLKRLDE